MIRFIVILLLLTSCGAKHKQSTRTKEHALTVQTNKLTSKESEGLKWYYTIDNNIKALTIEPVSPDKPMHLNGETYKNTRIKIITDKTESRAVSNASTLRETTEEHTKNEERAKTTRVTNSKILRVPIGLQIGLALVFILVGLYFVYRKTPKP